LQLLLQSQILPFFIHTRISTRQPVDKETCSLIALLDIFTLQITGLPPLLAIAKMHHTCSVSMKARSYNRYDKQAEQRPARPRLTNT
jgi:hypothetical protein